MYSTNKRADLAMAQLGLHPNRYPFNVRSQSRNNSLHDSFRTWQLDTPGGSSVATNVCATNVHAAKGLALLRHANRESTVSSSMAASLVIESASSANPDELTVAAALQYAEETASYMFENICVMTNDELKHDLVLDNGSVVFTVSAMATCKDGILRCMVLVAGTNKYYFVNDPGSYFNIDSNLSRQRAQRMLDVRAMDAESDETVKLNIHKSGLTEHGGKCLGYLYPGVEKVLVSGDLLFYHNSPVNKEDFHAAAGKCYSFYRDGTFACAIPSFCCNSFYCDVSFTFVQL